MTEASEWVTSRLRELRERSGLSMQQFAQEMGYKGASSVQRYEDAAAYKKTRFDNDLVERMANVLVGRGIPPITAEEMWELAGPEYRPSIPATSTFRGSSKLVTNGEVTKRPQPNASFPPRYERFPEDGYVPVIGQTIGGPNGRFVMNGSEVARVFVPAGLENVEGAYAVRVYGTSMEPRFKAGETVWLNPNEPVRAGDDVVAQLLNEDEDQPVESYIKEFRSMSASVLRLWQHNPDEGEKNELEFDRKLVFSIHKIVFHATV